MNIKFVRGSEILDNIVNNQRSLDDKTRLRYKESLNVVKGELSINMSTTKKPTSYGNLSRETKIILTNQEMKRRSSQNWINPTMQTNMKQGSNIHLNLIKLEDKDQFLQVSSSFQVIQNFSMDIVPLVVIFDIRL
jgi:hypothetical protein